MSRFYRMDPFDWDDGCEHLSLEQEAAYLRIVNAICKYDRPIHNSPRVLAGLMRTTPQRSKRLVRELLEAGKITIDDGGRIHNKRAEAEIAHRKHISSARQAVAKGSRRALEEVDAKPLKKLNGHNAIAPLIDKNRIDKNNTTPLFPTGSCEEAVELWNDMARRTGLNAILRLNGTRRAKLTNSLTEVNGVDGWRRALDKVEHSAFLKGGSDQKWKVTFDWLIETSNITKVLEGNYDDRRDPLAGLTREEREIFLRHSAPRQG